MMSNVTLDSIKTWILTPSYCSSHRSFCSCKWFIQNIMNYIAKVNKSWMLNPFAVLNDSNSKFNLWKVSFTCRSSDSSLQIAYVICVTKYILPKISKIFRFLITTIVKFMAPASPICPVFSKQCLWLSRKSCEQPIYQSFNID